MSEIDTNKVYKKLKEHRGERFARKLRDADLLDIPNIEHILEFANLEDLDALIPIVRSRYKILSLSKYEAKKDPLQLLNEAGYDAFVVQNEKQKNSIEKYFRPNEKLCTFNDPNRHINFYIIHAVKRGASKIKPSPHPEREDEYGTSVISIQIAKSGGFISIKNRYNHTVNNPDSTFHNNPDNIILGLTNSLQRYFNVDFNVSEVSLPDNYVVINDQLVRYDLELDGILFGYSYYIKNGVLTRLNTDYETIIDYMIYNSKDKTITSPITNDKTCKLFAGVFNGKQVTKTVDTVKQTTTLQTPNGDCIVTNNKGQIIELDLPSVTEIGDDFLKFNTSLESANLPNVKKIGNYFLWHNKILKHINLSNVESIGYNFMSDNKELEIINLPKVKTIGNDFLSSNEKLKSINMQNVEKIGYNCLQNNETLTSINLSNAKEIGDYFLQCNEVLEFIYLPKDTKLGEMFLPYNYEYEILEPQLDKSEIMKKATERLNNKVELQDKEKDLPLPKPGNNR